MNCAWDVDETNFIQGRPCPNEALWLVLGGCLGYHIESYPLCGLHVKRWIDLFTQHVIGCGQCGGYCEEYEITPMHKVRKVIYA